MIFVDDKMVNKFDVMECIALCMHALRYIDLSRCLSGYIVTNKILSIITRSCIIT